MEDEAQAKIEIKKLELIQKAKVNEASQSVKACWVMTTGYLGLQKFGSVWKAL